MAVLSGAMRANASAFTRMADPRLRGALLMPLGALATHQLRYQLAFGGHTAARLARDGHGYLIAAEPFVLLAAALAVGGFVGAVARAAQGRAPRRGQPRLARVIAACALALLALYCAQELFESFFAPGHPAGLTGVFGHGGWIAIPASIVIGALLALTLKAADTVIRRIARSARPARRRRRSAAPVRPSPLAAAPAWRLDPLSGLAPSRPPPPATA